MQQRNISLDILRIIACIGVIVIHTSGSPIVHRMVETGALWYNECLIMDALVRWSVPVFAMLTGYFLLDPQKELPLKKLFSKYIARIVIALIVWSLFYAITLHKPLYPFGFQEAHLWYLEMLVGLYLSLPILRIIARHISTLKYFCLAWALYMCYLFLGNYCVLPFQLQEVIFLRYAGFCLAAYYMKVTLSSKDKNKGTATIIYVVGVIGLIVTITAALLSQNADTEWWFYDSPNVMATALAIFLFFERHPFVFNTKASLFIEKCSKCTFGIYLIHIWILIQVFFRAHRFIPNPIILIPICVGFTFCSSWIITWVIKKIPILNRYIV